MFEDINEETGEENFTVFDLGNFLLDFSSKIREFDGSNKELVDFYELTRLRNTIETEMMDIVSYQGEISDSIN